MAIKEDSAKLGSSALRAALFRNAFAEVQYLLGNYVGANLYDYDKFLIVCNLKSL